MAISIDTVYQRVLAIANKEQRGYITPQEFNLLANQAQMSIFESYFYTKNNRERIEADRDDTSESNIDELLSRKLAPFTTVAAVTTGTTFPAHYQIGNVYYGGFVCKKINVNELQRFLGSVRHTISEPVYIDSIETGEDIAVYSSGATVTTSITCDVVSKPAAVEWAYVVVNTKALYNSNATTDFTLHDSEENTLVMSILELAGVVMNKIGLVQVASGKVAIEKQSQNL